jgi:hypothetical protein
VFSREYSVVVDIKGEAVGSDAGMRFVNGDAFATRVIGLDGANNLLVFGKGSAFPSQTDKQLVIDYEGKVGISTGTPYARLHVRGAEGTQCTFRVDKPNGDCVVFVSSWGYVGIGTANPPEEFSVVGDIHARLTNGNPWLYLRREGTTIAAGIGGSIVFQNPYNTAGAVSTMCQIDGQKENATDGDVASYLRFWTRPSGGSMTERMRITSAGTVCIGATAPDTTNNTPRLEVTNNWGSTNWVRVARFLNSSGTTGLRTEIMVGWKDGQGAGGRGNAAEVGFYLAGDGSNDNFAYIGMSWGEEARIYADGRTMDIDGGTWGIYSDIRLKKNIKPLTGALDKICKLQGVTFEWKNPELHGCSTSTATVRAGFIGQDVEKVFPEFVSEVPVFDKDAELLPPGEKKAKMLSFPNDFFAYLVEAIKELKERNEQLEGRVKELEAVVKELEKRAR